MLPRQGRRALVAIFLSLLALNVVFALVTGRPEQTRRACPYSPFFLEQVEKGNVARDRQRGRDDRRPPQGKPSTTRPQGTDKTEKVDHFKTQVPTFVNTDELTKRAAQTRASC